MIRSLAIIALLSACQINPMQYGTDSIMMQVNGYTYDVRMKDGQIAATLHDIEVLSRPGVHQPNLIVAMEKATGCELKHVQFHNVTAMAMCDDAT